jgi:NAD(P)-dependent dehydrogenase (short-subunit alcohol dehydrogenase family)
MGPAAAFNWSDGLIVTEGTEQNYQGERRAERQGVPLGHVGEPQDIADVIVLLCSTSRATSAVRSSTSTAADRGRTSL